MKRFGCLLHLFFLLNAVLMFDFRYHIERFDHVLVINHFWIFHNLSEDVIEDD